MTDSRELVPSVVSWEPARWRLIAWHLRNGAGKSRAFWDEADAECEAVECEWRAEMLDHVWTCSEAWIVMAEARADGSLFDEALARAWMS